MSTIKIEAELSTDKLVEAAGKLSAQDLEDLVGKLLALQARTKAASLNTEESDLLAKVNSGLASGTQMRYQALREKLQQETLTTQEHDELRKLTGEIEQKQVERLEALVQLSHLRGTSLRELMDALGIQTPAAE